MVVVVVAIVTAVVGSHRPQVAGHCTRKVAPRRSSWQKTANAASQSPASSHTVVADACVVVLAAVHLPHMFGHMDAICSAANFEKAPDGSHCFGSTNAQTSASTPLAQRAWADWGVVVDVSVAEVVVAVTVVVAEVVVAVVVDVSVSVVAVRVVVLGVVAVVVDVLVVEVVVVVMVVVDVSVVMVTVVEVGVVPVVVVLVVVDVSVFVVVVVAVVDVDVGVVVVVVTAIVVAVHRPHVAGHRVRKVAPRRSSLQNKANAASQLSASSHTVVVDVCMAVVDTEGGIVVAVVHLPHMFGHMDVIRWAKGLEKAVDGSQCFGFTCVHTSTSTPLTQPAEGAAVVAGVAVEVVSLVAALSVVEVVVVAVFDVFSVPVLALVTTRTVGVA